MDNIELMKQLLAEYRSLEAQQQGVSSERRDNLQTLRDEYLNSSAAKMTPEMAGFRGAMAGFLVPGTNSAAKSYEYEQQHRALQDLMNRGGLKEFDTYYSDEDKHLKALQLGVLKQLEDAHNNRASYKPHDWKVVGDSLVRVTPESGQHDVVYENIKNSPLYKQASIQAEKELNQEKVVFTGPNAAADMARAIDERAARLYAQWVSVDVVRNKGDSSVRSPVPMDIVTEQPSSAMTNAGATGQTTRVSPEKLNYQEADVTNLQAQIAELDAELSKPGLNNVQTKALIATKKQLADHVARLTTPTPPAHQTQQQLAAALGVNQSVVPKGGPRVMTPQQLANVKEQGQLEAKSYEELKAQNSAYRAANDSILPMEGVLLSGKNTSGVAHEALNKVGGWMNYIDPKGALAQSAGNDAAYFSKMMDLVREKIKALGAGTAVSNLDLIVTQKSVGDLRNTPQGNLKTLGLMKLFNATMAELNDRKIGYYDQSGNTFQGYKSSKEPTHAVIHRRVPMGNSTVFTYDLETKDQWVKRLQAANPGKTLSQETIDRQWKIYADNSVKDMFK